MADIEEKPRDDEVRVIYIRLNKEGVLLMRNCGEKYENTEGTDVHFRFDYTLM